MTKKATSSAKDADLKYLRSVNTVRKHCSYLLSLGRMNQLRHFSVFEEQLAEVAEYVVEEMHLNYPNDEIPYHGRIRHLNTGGLNRVGQLQQELASTGAHEWAQALFQLVVISVFLDAGAGPTWKYQEPDGRVFQRSEGLAVASFHMFKNGFFSSIAAKPFQVDAAALKQLNEEKLAAGLQVHAENQVVGLSGRVALLNKLGEFLDTFSPSCKSQSEKSLGAVYDVLWQELTQNSQNIEAVEILDFVLSQMGGIWPNGTIWNGHNIGDVGEHSQIKEGHQVQKLVPFHKLSQWLTYSLLEVFEEAGARVQNLDILTGLPEYRNGGLFLDFGVLKVKDQNALQKSWKPQSEFVVEWRALTLALLDELADIIRTRLKKDGENLPLARILQGGTWSAGRKIAKKLRRDAGSPIKLDSDGTIF